MQVRNYYDGDTDNDLLMRVIDLRDDVVILKIEQESMTEYLSKVITFVKMIELLIVEPDNKNEGNT